MLALSSSVHMPGLKALASSMSLSLQKSLVLDSGLISVAITTSSGSFATASELDANYQIPFLAHSFYSQLTDLHDMFSDFPTIDGALVYVRKMLMDVDTVKEVDCQVLSHVHRFWIVVEELIVALNSAAHSPIKKEQNNPKDLNFYDLPDEETYHVLFAQALRRQARKFDRVVAIVDSSSLAGIKSYWNTTAPPEVAKLGEQCFISDTSFNDGEQENSEIWHLLVDMPMVVVGAGAAAVVGVSSLSKVIHFLTFMKMAAFKVPALLNIGLAQTKKSAVIAMGKVFSLAKFLTSTKGFVSGKITIGYGAHAPTVMEVVATVEKLQIATHSMIASAEQSSMSAMRTAFSGIM